MSSKEKWITDVENSLQGIKPAETDPYLFSKILTRLERTQEQLAPVRAVWLAAASFVLLALINILVLTSQPGGKQRGRNDMQALSRELQLLNTNTIDYNP